MKCLVVQKPDGNVAIVSPAPANKEHRKRVAHWQRVHAENAGVSGADLDALEAAFINATLKVDAAELPASKRFRNAWRVKNKKVVEDLEACKVLKHEQLLAENAEIGRAVAYLKTQHPEKTDEIAALEQELADAVAECGTVQDMTTVDAVASCRPAVHDTWNRVLRSK